MTRADQVFRLFCVPKFDWNDEETLTLDRSELLVAAPARMQLEGACTLTVAASSSAEDAGRLTLAAGTALTVPQGMSLQLCTATRLEGSVSVEGSLSFQDTPHRGQAPLVEVLGSIAVGGNGSLTFDGAQHSIETTASLTGSGSVIIGYTKQTALTIQPGAVWQFPLGG